MLVDGWVGVLMHGVTNGKIIIMREENCNSRLCLWRCL